jgi:hypothetical protein
VRHNVILFWYWQEDSLSNLKQNTTKYQTLTNLASSDVDTCVEAGRLLVADLYDPKGSAKSVHRDVNKLRVKLALYVVSHPVRE